MIAVTAKPCHPVARGSEQRTGELRPGGRGVLPHPRDRRVGVARPWFYVGVNLAVGLSCALPLYPWARERTLQRREARDSGAPWVRELERTSSHQREPAPSRSSDLTAACDAPSAPRGWPQAPVEKLLDELRLRRLETERCAQPCGQILERPLQTATGLVPHSTPPVDSLPSGG